jgi:orotate phosphoribosyltransferase
MELYQQQFIEFCLANGALRFGEFTLKSGRKSPYFYNAGMFQDGKALQQIGEAYARTIQTHFADQYDVLLGAAYKGIPLVTATSIGLVSQFQLNTPVSFNRKEAKDHGEGGMIIGTSLQNKRVLLVDDVISAGTTVREIVELVKKNQGKLIGMVISMDREERGLKSALSAIAEVEKEFNLKVISIVTCSQLIEYLQTHNKGILQKLIPRYSYDRADFRVLSP